MNRRWLNWALSGKGLPASRRLLAVLVVTVSLASWAHGQAGQAVARKSPSTHSISAAQFSAMIRDFSEEEGNFFSDNYVSNETSYLHVVDKLKELGVSGGAYIGVGPEQNFTYIAKIHPQIAFIVDIRRQAMIQHLMYKAIFQLSPNRAQFLSRLYSKPLERKDAPGRDSSIGAMMEYFSKAPTTDALYASNLASIRKTIEKDFEFPLSPRDLEMLGRVFTAFHQGNQRITFRFRGGGGYGGFPTMQDLMLATDLNGKQGGFLASEEDYKFVRDLHRKNRIIPVVGDFAGPKALATVAGYLRQNGYTLSAYYTSNVEEFLFGDHVFGAFAENVRKLPIDDHSVFIRAFRAGWQGHPAYVPGHRMVTVLEKLSVFLKDQDEGLYPDYWSLITTDYISGNATAAHRPSESTPAVPQP